MQSLAASVIIAPNFVRGFAGFFFVVAKRAFLP
jgi:hypothetical protein